MQLAVNASLGRAARALPQAGVGSLGDAAVPAPQISIGALGQSPGSAAPQVRIRAVPSHVVSPVQLQLKR